MFMYVCTCVPTCAHLQAESHGKRELGTAWPATQGHSDLPVRTGQEN